MFNGEQFSQVITHQGSLVRISGRVDAVDSLPPTGSYNQMYLVGLESATRFDKYLWNVSEHRWDYKGVSAIMDWNEKQDVLILNTTGTSEAQVITEPRIPELYEGLEIVIIPSVSLSASTTLNLNGLGAKPICRRDGNTDKAYLGNCDGWLKAGSSYKLIYTGGNFIVTDFTGVEGVGNIAGKAFTVKSIVRTSGNAGYFVLDTTPEAFNALAEYFTARAEWFDMGFIAVDEFEKSLTYSVQLTFTDGSSVREDFVDHITAASADPTSGEYRVYSSNLLKTISNADKSIKHLNYVTDGVDNELNIFKLPYAPRLGNRNMASYAHLEGLSNAVHSKGSHVEGSSNTAAGMYSHAEGSGTFAMHYAHAEGEYTQALGVGAHAEGVTTIAGGVGAHAEGDNSVASGDNSHAEGVTTQATAMGAHAEGNNTIAEGFGAHAEGCSTRANADYAHAEGYNTQASGLYSHAEGNYANASGYYSHAEGNSTTASGETAHSEGRGCIASGDYSHAEGDSTTAVGENQHVQGRYNMSLGNMAHIVGNGTWETASNAHTLDWSGNAWFAGSVTVGANKERLLSTSDLGDIEEALDGAVAGLNTAMYEKANSEDVLTKSNDTEYVPTEPYHPATKDYVDDAVAPHMLVAVHNVTPIIEVFEAFIAGKTVVLKVGNQLFPVGYASVEDYGANLGQCGIIFMGLSGNPRDFNIRSIRQITYRWNSINGRVNTSYDDDGELGIVTESGGSITGNFYYDDNNSWDTKVATRGYVDEQVSNVSMVLEYKANSAGVFERFDYTDVAIAKKADKTYVDEQVGDIETAIDGIIAIQNQLIGVSE